jgi:hypothetical protein
MMQESENNPQLLSELRRASSVDELILQEVRAIRTETSETNTAVHTLKNDFDRHAEQFQPIYEDHIYNKKRKEARADVLKHWSWRIGIIGGILTIVGVIFKWG